HSRSPAGEIHLWRSRSRPAGSPAHIQQLQPTSARPTTSSSSFFARSLRIGPQCHILSIDNTHQAVTERHNHLSFIVTAQKPVSGPDTQEGRRSVSSPAFCNHKRRF